MNASGSFRLVLLVTINFLLNIPANAGVMKRYVRIVREVYPPDIEPENEGIQPQVCIVGDVVYGAEETVPAEQSCLKCRCQPPGVQCETVQCAKKPGCKAIHRSNRCCPDYQCECEHNGKIYANGEKLETNPGGECKVCYCRGGEVQCAEVSCYIRNDCEGRRIPGTCCPKYDHCPPIDALLDRSSAITEAPVNTLKPMMLDLWQEQNTTEVTSSSPIGSVPEDSNKVPDASDVATALPSFQDIAEIEDGQHSRITIQEIIPERKEIPITAPPKIYLSEPQGTLIIEEALPTNENGSNDLSVDSEPESSEVSEVFQHPPPVLRIGDKLLFLKQGDLVPENDTTTPDSVITIIGAEGLQRGGVEESLEVHEVKIEPDTEVQEIGENIEIKDAKKISSISTSPENEGGATMHSLNVTKEIGDTETNDLELRPAESTHILSLVKRKDKTTITTSTQRATTQNEDALTTQMSSIQEPRRYEPQNQSTGSTSITGSTVLPESEVNISTTILPATELPTTKSLEAVVEQNPAYPPIPDIMPAVGDAAQKFDVELENDNSTSMEVKILPEVLDFLSNKTRNQTHSEWLKSNEVKPLGDFKTGTLPNELLNQRSPIDEEVETTTHLAESTTPAPNGENVTNNSEVKSMTAELAETIHLEENNEQNMLKEGAQLIAEMKISNAEPSTESPSIVTIHSTISEINDHLKETTISDKTVEDALKKAVVSEELKQNSSFEASISIPKVIESIEIDSGEQTTPKTNHSSVLSNEDASVESIQNEDNDDRSSETHDMAKISNIELGSVELANDKNAVSIPKDVEVINSVQTSTDNIMKQDVEFIHVLNTPKPTKLGKVETSTYELLPTPEETKSKRIIKREIDKKKPEDDIFKDLERELNAELAYSSKAPEEEQAEADRIFKELHDEAEGKITSTKSKSEEQEKVDVLADALAGVALKGKIPDSNLFRLIGGLFGSERE